MERTVFNPAQLHLLNMLSHIHTDQGLDRLKNQLEAFYAKQIDTEMDKLWENGEWNEQTLQDLKGSHFRTPHDR
jgi:hypothetical protein